MISVCVCVSDGDGCTEVRERKNIGKDAGYTNERITRGLGVERLECMGDAYSHL